MKKLIAILLTLLLITFVGCKKDAIDSKTPEQKTASDFGKIENDTYTNSYLGVSLNIPANWTILNNDEQKQLLNSGKKAISGKNDKEANNVETNIYLLSSFKYKLENTNTDFNPSITVLGEKIDKLPEIKSASSYIEQTKKVLDDSKIGYQFPTPISTQKIDKKDFSKLEASVTFEKTKVNQIYYATIVKDYVFSIIISYSDPKDLKELNSSIDSIKFSETK